MANVAISGDTSGAVTLTVPSTVGTQTATFPAATGTVMVSGNMPAFSYYSSGGTSVPDSTFTKVLYATKNFDTNNNFASSRFTPTVAGYYQINANTRYGSITSANNVLRMYKNGSSYVNGASTGVVNGYVYMMVSAIVYLNGSTDYVEIYAFQASGTTQSTDSATEEQFSGCLLRSA
jgi:hypothetical protein